SPGPPQWPIRSPSSLNSRTGGAAAQQSAFLGCMVAYCSLASSEPWRWMIQIWSLESTDTPITEPITQWFGSGFGHIGSTSNRGAWTPAASARLRNKEDAAQSVRTVAGTAFAHDIPVDATVQSFVKPEGNRLHFVVRVPLQTMRDVDVPVDARGFLDLDALGPKMPDAATLWIGNFVRIYEDDSPLPKPRVVAT